MWSCRTSTPISSAGSERGCARPLILGNSIEMALAMFAFHAAGGQAVPINPAYTPRELDLIIRDAAPRVGIVDTCFGRDRRADEVLSAHPDVLEAAAIGVPEAYRAEIVRAFVVARPGRHPTREALLAHCAASLAK